MKKLYVFLALLILTVSAGCSPKQTGMAVPKKEIGTSPSVLTQAEPKILVANAIKDFYGDTCEPILIYQQIPFEDGILALAEKLQDGEHYPDLYFIDKSGKVLYHTLGSYCWTLNYTQFKGCYIFFGLAGVEARRYDQNSLHVIKVEAIFADQTESVVPEENVISQISPMEKDTRSFMNPQGYIMPVKGQKIPEDFVAELEDGSKISLSTKSKDWQSEYMPDYLQAAQADIKNSFAYTFTSMLSPSEWRKGYMEGEICLKGRPDANNNLNALFLRSAGHMKSADSFILPQEIKPFYLSNNYPRLAEFSAGETVRAVYPEQRKLLDCHTLSLTADMIDKEISRDSFAAIAVNERGQIVLPNQRGYYLFVLRTAENTEIQTYTGVFKID